ncbi:hypothetical protein [Winogradskyella thalassocola]|uniref:Uncharacterized protein n=1 Tax=Winogradskyella thalassocola TaxID=262004 RepID=A0A1G8CU26_9FLAO|nr:hypothetical protein [Winogradskyella thalassocola]SDH48948.1 hypothetical protein SAMN04489796_10348 [Winogradskyella thalassocola]
MKNILIVIVMVFLSSSNKETPTKNHTGLIATSKNVETTKNYNPEIITETIKINDEELRSDLYKGTLNSNIKISLYLKEQEYACGGSTFFYAMYKYENQDKWILLDVTTNREQNNYCMIERNFSGVLFLKETSTTLNGKWISPDTSKQFKVELKSEELDIKFAKDHTAVETLDEILFDDLLYNANDC